MLLRNINRHLSSFSAAYFLLLSVVVGFSTGKYLMPGNLS